MHPQLGRMLKVVLQGWQPPRNKDAQANRVARTCGHRHRILNPFVLRVHKLNLDSFASRAHVQLNRVPTSSSKRTLQIADGSSR